MAVIPIYDRVAETTTTTGTGTLTLAGAASKHRAFSTVGDGNTTFYCIVHQTADEWEVGTGVYTSAGTTLSRAAILASSNAGAAVDFSAGTKDVFLPSPAARGNATTTEVLTGTDETKLVTPDALAALWEQGSNIASAGTITVGEGGYFVVTGTTTITDIDFGVTKGGRVVILEFAGALTLSFDSTNLILPTDPPGNNITTAAGDIAVFACKGGDVAKCIIYQRASGVPTNAGLAQIGLLADPNADRILFWDDSAGSYAYLRPHTGLTVTTTDLTVNVATQAEQEALNSASAFVTPSTQQYHPSACKGWASWEEIGTWGTNSSYNVSSITDSGTGIGIVNWNIDFSAATYPVIAWGDSDVATASNAGQMINQTGITAGTWSFRTNSSAGTATDFDVVCVAAFGDQ